MTARDDYPLLNNATATVAFDTQAQAALDEIDLLRQWKADATDEIFRLDELLDRYTP